MTEASAPPSSRRVGPIQKLLFAIAVPVLFLGLIEGGARLFLDDPADAPLLIPDRRRDKWQRSELHRSDPHLFWRNRANADIDYNGIRVRTNDLGLRDDPAPVEKPPGEIRVLSLGESTTFGSKVEQDRTYSAVLEDCLARRLEDWSVDVLNAGTPGWSLVQSWVYLEREGVRLGPDVVLVYHGYNDFLPTSFVSRRTGGGREAPEGSDAATDLELVRRRGSGIVRVGSWLHEHSRAFRWLAHRLRSVSGDGSAAEGAPIESRVGEGSPRVPRDDRLEVLRRMLETTRSRGIALVLLVPVYREFLEHREVLLEFARENDVTVVDLERAVEALGGDRARLFEDPSHPGAELHAEFAAQICELLVDRLLPPH